MALWNIIRCPEQSKILGRKEKKKKNHSYIKPTLLNIPIGVAILKSDFIDQPRFQPLTQTHNLSQRKPKATHLPRFIETMNCMYSGKSP